MRYADKLRLPEWREFRDHVLTEKGETCEDCGVIANPPHVHHNGYVSGREPWEYELHEVKVLCEACHETIHELQKEFDALFASLDGQTLILMFRAIMMFSQTEIGEQGRFAHQTYVSFKREYARLNVERTHRNNPEEPQWYRSQVLNTILGFTGETLDAWMSGLDIFKAFSKDEQREVAENICRFIEQEVHQRKQG